jgi:F420H(2)-dependent quinone reductase
VDESIRRALARGHTIDITTTGRVSGLPRRIEMVFHSFGGRIYISGLPSSRKRAWLGNLEQDPVFTFHLKRAVKADLPGIARIITDETERRAVLELVANAWNRTTDLERMVAQSPLIEVTFPGLEA